MGQWVKALAAMPDDMGSIPGTRTVEGENWLRQAALHSCYGVHTYRHMNTTNTIKSTQTNNYLPKVQIFPNPQNYIFKLKSKKNLHFQYKLLSYCLY